MLEHETLWKVLKIFAQEWSYDHHDVGLTLTYLVSGLSFGKSSWNIQKILSEINECNRGWEQILNSYQCVSYFDSFEFKAVLLKLTANVQSDNSFLRCSKFTPFELSAPAPQCTKMVFGSHFFTVWSIMMKLHKNDRSNKSSLLE